MVFLITIPVFLAVAALQRYLAIYAPTNVLIRRMRSSQPRPRAIFMLIALTTILLTAMKVALDLAAQGEPGWLNVVALILAWDAVRLALLAVVCGVRCIIRSVTASAGGSRTGGPKRVAS